MLGSGTHYRICINCINGRLIRGNPQFAITPLNLIPGFFALLSSLWPRSSELLLAYTGTSSEAEAAHTPHGPTVIRPQSVGQAGRTFASWSGSRTDDGLRPMTRMVSSLNQGYTAQREVLPSQPRHPPSRWTYAVQSSLHVHTDIHPPRESASECRSCNAGLRPGLLRPATRAALLVPAQRAVLLRSSKSKD